MLSERRHDKLIFYGIVSVRDDINSGKYDVISYYGAGRTDGFYVTACEIKVNLKKILSGLILIFLRNVKRPPLLGFSVRKVRPVRRIPLFSEITFWGLLNCLIKQKAQLRTQFVHQFLCSTDCVSITFGLQASY